MADAFPGTERFDLDTGVLCLDFVNTLGGRYDDEPDDLLARYADLLAFGVAAGSVEAGDARRLAALAERHPGVATRTLAGARAARETLFAIFSAVAASGVPQQADLDALAPWIGRAGSRQRLRVEGDAVVAAWAPIDDSDPASLDYPLWPVIHDAIDLLTHGDPSRVRECAADDCGWLFLDTSRNRSRRWCSMQSCGNRAKVSHFRERQRG